jgi:hypothetical protein
MTRESIPVRLGLSAGLTTLVGWKSLVIYLLASAFELRSATRLDAAGWGARAILLAGYGSGAASAATRGGEAATMSGCGPGWALSS